MSLAYVGVYSSYYTNRNNVPLTDPHTPVINRNFRFRIKEYEPESGKKYSSISTRRHASSRGEMRVERSDIHNKLANKYRDDVEDDSYNERISTQYFLTRERDIALDNNKAFKKKLVMGQCESRESKRNLFEEAPFLHKSKQLEAKLSVKMEQIHNEQVRLLNKSSELDMELKEAERRRRGNISAQLNTISRRKRIQLENKLTELEIHKFLELNTSALNMKSKFAQLKNELLAWKQQKINELNVELKELERKLLERTRITRRTLRIAPHTADARVPRKPLSVAKANAVAHKAAANAAAAAAAAATAAAAAIANRSKSAPLESSLNFDSSSFKEFVNKQESLTRQLNEYHKTTGGRQSAGLVLHTPTNFKPFVNHLHDKIFEQKINFCPFYNKSSANEKKRHELSVGYYEMIQSRERFKKAPARSLTTMGAYVRNIHQSIYQQRDEDEFASHTDSGFLTGHPIQLSGFVEPKSIANRRASTDTNKNNNNQQNQQQQQQQGQGQGIFTSSETKSLNSSRSRGSRGSRGGGSASAGSIGGTGTGSGSGSRGVGGGGASSFSKFEIQTKDFGDLKYLIKKFPPVGKILLNGQHTIDTLKSNQPTRTQSAHVVRRRRNSIHAV